MERWARVGRIWQERQLVAEREHGRRRQMMRLAMAMFLVTGMTAIAGNSLMGHGLHLDWTISEYVGLETWSALLFALGNCVVAGCMGWFMYDLGREWEFPRWFYWVVIGMAVGLIGLSVCPVGYFVERGFPEGPDFVHKLCSRGMFMMMLVVAALLAWSQRAAARTKFWSVMFVGFGLTCVAGYFLGASWFLNLVLLFEATYLLSFMVLCVNIKGKERE